MKFLKRSICLFLCVLLALTAFSFVSYAEEDVMADDEWESILNELGISDGSDTKADAEKDRKTDKKQKKENKENKEKATEKSPGRMLYMNEYLDTVPDTVSDTAVHLDALSVTCVQTDIQSGIHDNPQTALVWNEQEQFSWSFECDAGRYELYAKYVTVDDSGIDPTRSLLIDGVSPYSEAQNIAFHRLWVTQGEIRTDSNGDQVRPSVAEKQVWQEQPVFDSSGYYSSPLTFYLDSGTHTLTLEYISTPIAIEWIELRPKRAVKSYKEVFDGYKKQNVNGELLTYQAEEIMVSRSDATIRIESNGDPATLPNSYGYTVFNSVGGYRWRTGGQSVNFELDVKKSGYYKLAFRYLQSWNDGVPSYRSIAVDGEIPFAEFSAYKFPYSADWQTEVLSDESDNPYYIYLEKGSHTLTLTAVLGEFTPIIQSLYDEIELLSDIVMDITKLTGTEPDSNYDYQFFKFLPNTKTDMERLIDELKSQCKNINKICGRTTSVESTVLSVIKQIEAMVNDPFSIAKRYSQLTDAQTSLGDWYLTSKEQPLLLDCIFVATKDKDIPVLRSSLWQRIRSTAINFGISFLKDYNNVGSVLDENVKITDSIKIWIARGSEWAEIIKGMTDEDFTPKTQIAVNINTVPSSQLNTGSSNVLLLSVISGKAPDIAMGVSASSPVEFAVRDTVVDLNSFEDFGEIQDRFLPQIIIPFKYNGGVYALPETMNFSALFYRTDICREYGISVPDNRNELYGITLPLLYRNGMEYYQPQGPSQFLYQNGAKYYSDDGHYSALDSYEAYLGFKEYTDMFTQYGCPVTANFFNRFRSGEMPMGIGDYSLFIKLCTSAPELNGKWAIAPIVGRLREDGTVDRSTDGIAAECDIILSGKNNDKHNSCWEFLKWWSSDDVQRKYSREIEALQGVSARWNTANKNAFFSLAFSKEDISVIREQLSQTTETPVVLGGYYTSRYILNAFTNIVVSSNMSVRDALEDAVEKINRELKVKQEEYGIFIDNDTKKE